LWEQSFYCPHAIADSIWHIQIRKNTLELSSVVVVVVAAAAAAAAAQQ